MVLLLFDSFPPFITYSYIQEKLSFPPGINQSPGRRGARLHRQPSKAVVSTSPLSEAQAEALWVKSACEGNTCELLTPTNTAPPSGQRQQQHNCSQTTTTTTRRKHCLRPPLHDFLSSREPMAHLDSQTGVGPSPIPTPPPTTRRSNGCLMFAACAPDNEAQ